MSTRGQILVAALAALVAALSAPLGLAQSGQSFTTLVTTPLPIEGLTGDGTFLYTVGRGTDSCPVWRINPATPRGIPASGGPGSAPGNRARARSRPRAPPR